MAVWNIDSGNGHVECKPDHNADAKVNPKIHKLGNIMKIYLSWH